MVEAKGIELLLEAVCTLGDGVELRIAGTGPLDELLRQHATGDARVRLFGALPSGAMPDFYRGLDVLVLPTLGRWGWTEQFGRAAIEAMACGVPVVVSDAGELPAVVGEAGRVVPSADVDALREALPRPAGRCPEPHVSRRGWKVASAAGIHPRGHRAVHGGVLSRTDGRAQSLVPSVSSR